MTFEEISIGDTLFFRPLNRDVKVIATTSDNRAVCKFQGDEHITEIVMPWLAEGITIDAAIRLLKNNCPVPTIKPGAIIRDISCEVILSPDDLTKKTT